MFDRIKNNKYPHQISLTFEEEMEAAVVMKHEGRDFTNAAVRCFHDKYVRIKQADRERIEAEIRKELEERK
jgi:hypothetical protein